MAIRADKSESGTKGRLTQKMPGSPMVARSTHNDGGRWGLTGLSGCLTGRELEIHNEVCRCSLRVSKLCSALAEQPASFYFGIERGVGKGAIAAMASKKYK